MDIAPFICKRQSRASKFQCLFAVLHTKYDTHVRVHWPVHQAVHNELTELVAIVAVDGVCQTDNNLQIVHVYVPVRMISLVISKIIRTFAPANEKA